MVSGSGSDQPKENQRGGFVQGAAWAAVVLPVISAELSQGVWGCQWKGAALFSS